MNIYFDKSLKSDFLKAQNLTTDEAGYVVDAQTKKKIQDDFRNDVKTVSFGGFRKGSRHFLTENIETVMKEAALRKA